MDLYGLMGEVYGNHGVYHESFSCKKPKEYRGMGQHDPGWWYIEGWFLSGCATLPKYLDGQCREVRFEFLSVSGSLHCYVDYPIMQWQCISSQGVSSHIWICWGLAQKMGQSNNWMISANTSPNQKGRSFLFSYNIWESVIYI